MLKIYQSQMLSYQNDLAGICLESWRLLAVRRIKDFEYLPYSLDNLDRSILQYQSALQTVNLEAGFITCARDLAIPKHRPQPTIDFI
jgi:hypothetical protein